MTEIINFVENPIKILLALGARNIFPISDKLYLKLRFKNKLGYELSLEMPRTFNEKIQWLKLYDRNPEYIKMVDKYTVKKYVEEKIGKQYIIPTLGVWDKFEDIDFNILPNQFVLKCTHDSGGVVICKDKMTLDKIGAKKIIKRALKRNYYWSGREWPYKYVKPKIIVEKYLGDLSDELKDYKFMCFSGKVKCSFVCSGRYSKEGLTVTFFDNDWNEMPFERHYPKSKSVIPKPNCLNKMITLAEVLSHDIPFVRVDFYEVYNKIYFGEMTFFPGSGFEEFTPVEWDYKLGEWLVLPYN